MHLEVIHTGYFKLDGGAMFGVVPKSIWNKLNPADDKNLCTWSMRCLLISMNNRLVLIDNGIGDKQSDKFFSHYYLHGEFSLESSLKKVGVSFDDITDVFLTHLHFDHCGGGVARKKSSPDQYETVFRNATYWSNTNQWEWAINSNAREKASFLTENILPMQESGQLAFIDENQNGLNGIFDFITVNGHTDHQMLPKIQYKGKSLVFMADLLPSVAHIPLPYIMSYDTRPLLTLQEKTEFLQEAVSNDYILYFEHDPQIECCTLQHTEKGIRVKDTFNLMDI